MTGTIADPPTADTFKALKNVFTILPEFNFFQFLQFHGVNIPQRTIDRPPKSHTIDIFLTNTNILDDAFNGDDFEFDEMFQRFGQAKDWIENWNKIGTDILDLNHYLTFREYYWEKSLKLLLVENLGLELCNGSSSAGVTSFSRDQLFMERFMKGSFWFVGENVGLQLKIDQSDLCKIPDENVDVMFVRDPDLDEYGIVYYQNKRVILKDLGKLKQLEGQLDHINLGTVILILKEFFVPNGHAVFQQPDGSYKLCLDVVPLPDASDLKALLLASYTQNGKTNQIIALIWILFFCHGYGSYMLCRSDAQEYHILFQAIGEFNKALVEWSKTSMHFNGDIKQYQIIPKPLSHATFAQLKNSPIMDEDGKLRCICRIRLLQASNAKQAEAEIEYLNNDIQGLGQVSTRHKYAVIVDEAQNTHQSLEIASQLEKAVLKLMRRVAICIEVSATQEAALVLKSTEKVDMLFIPAKPNYYGYSRRLPEDRMIDILPLEAYFQDEMLGIKQPNTAGEMTTYGQNGIMRKLLDESETFPPDGKRHWLCVVSAGNNRALEEMGNLLLANLNDRNYPLPVIVVIAIASAAHNGRGAGATILFNKVAGEYLTREMVSDADRHFHMTDDDIESLPDAQQRKFTNQFGGRIKKGFVVLDPNKTDGSTVTYLNRRCSVDDVSLGVNDCGVYKLNLPRVGGYYRLRMQLSLVERIMESLNHPKYTVITIGNRLIREGVTPKTVYHTLAPDKMFCLYQSNNFAKRTVVALTQTMGRLCGIRRDNRKPTLYIRGDCLNAFQTVISFNEDTMHTVNEFQGACTVEEIMMFYADNIAQTFHPLIRNIRADDYWPKQALWKGMTEMREFFRSLFRSNFEECSFDDVTEMVGMMLFIERERVDNDDIEDWYYPDDFNQTVDRMHKIMSILLKPSFSTWVDQSSVDGNFDMPVACRRYPDHTKNHSIGFRINCARSRIQQGLVVCICDDLFNGVVSHSSPTRRCQLCRLHYHVICLPCISTDEESPPICMHCSGQDDSGKRGRDEDAFPFFEGDTEQDSYNEIELFSHDSVSSSNKKRSRFLEVPSSATANLDF